MSFSLPRRRLATDSVEMDITPMIDITFLLLIFFLVASRMDASVSLALPEARHGTAVVTKDSIVVSLQASGNDGVAVYRGAAIDPNHRLDATDPEILQTQLAEYLRTELRKGGVHVVIRAEKSVRHRHVDQVLRSIGAAVELPVYVAVLERQ